MKKSLQLLTLLMISLSFSPWMNKVFAGSPPPPVTNTIGPTGAFLSITAALANLTSNPATGTVIWELQSSYVSTVETFPISFTNANLNGINATNTLTIRPETGATGLVITSAAAQTINLNGGHHVTFDGRPGGIGTTSQLKIANTLATGIAIQFINIGSNNSIVYCEITGINTSTTTGVMLFGTTAPAGTLGNSNNLIDHCSIHQGATLPVNLVVSLGTSAKLNMSNTISNCNVYNWFATGYVNSYGVWLSSYNDSWNITGNSFYQEAARAVFAAYFPLYIQSGNSHIIAGNYIGGSAPLCGSGPMIINQIGSYGYSMFAAMSLTGGTTLAPLSIQGNTIQNIQMNQTANSPAISYPQALIILNAATLNMGNITPNIIGSETVANSVTINKTAAYAPQGYLYGIYILGAGTANITNNIFCGIGATCTQAITGTVLAVIANTSANTVISGNTIGSTTLANAISQSGYSQLYGIYSSVGPVTITNNIFSNLTLSNTESNAALYNQLFGIRTSNTGVSTITGNTVQNLTSAAPSTGSGTTASIIGIYAGSSTAGQIISQNVIKGLSNTTGTAAVNITGIHFQGGATPTNTVSRNFIHSLSLSSSATTSGIAGIYANAGTASFQNNMIRLGIDATGSGLNTGYAINGIYDAAGTNNYYFNSVYIGGAGVTGTTSSTFGFNSAASGTTRIIMDNIFVNARSGGSTGTHGAICFPGTTPYPTGITSGYNLLYAPGSGGAIGFFNAAARTTLSDWQAATALDLGSGTGDPVFVNATGNTTAVDLHVTNPTPVEAGGILIASVLDDFDGNTRSGLTPTDVGADAGNFTLISDVFTPVITFNALPNTPSTTNLTLTGFATITDNATVSGGANLPRIYYKTASDANVFGANNNTFNGWKYTSATNSTSPYDFLLDYSLIYGGSIAPGDVVQYFIVAQDDANNLVSSFPGATASSPTNPVQNIYGTPPTLNINSFIIINNNISGTITIPGDYNNITGNGGLFNAINIGTVTGNVNVVIAGNLTEDGTHALNQWVENPPASNFTMTFSPGDASLKTISGTINSGLIRFNGADRVTIDGRFGGSGSYLEFENTNLGTSSSTFIFLADATGNTLKYISIKGSNPAASGGVVLFSTATATGNDNNNIDNCNIYNGVGLPANLIYSAGTTTTVTHYNSGITVSNSNLYDWNSATVNSFGISLITGNTDWIITGNSFYQTAARVLGNFTSGAISIVNTTNGNNFTVTNNFIGGDSPNAAIATIPMTFTGTGLFQGIGLSVAVATPSSVQGNTVRNISLSTGSLLGTHAGILLGAGAINCGNFTPNTIGSNTVANSIAVINTGTSAAQVFSGILAGTGTPATIVISNNVVSGIAVSGTSTGTTGLRGITFQGTGGPYTVTGNTIGSLTLANALSNSTAQALIGVQQGSATGAVTIQGNIISNLYQANTSAATNQLYGINKAGTASTVISGNNITNLVSSSALTGAGSAAALIGINCGVATTSLVTQNTVHSLSNIAPAAAVNIIGIFSTSATLVSRNLVHSLSMSSSATTAGMTGIYAGGGTSTYQNNMVRLGIDTAGTDINTGYAITGIYDGAGTNNYYFNSVYIGGTGVTGTTSATYAINSILTTARIFQNNIFVNARSGGTVGGAINHYAFKVAGTTFNPAGLTSSYNLFYSPGITGGVIGYFNAVNYTNLSAWQAATGQDVRSGYGDPLFVNPTGTSASVDLHVQTSTPIEASGWLIGSVTDDFDGEIRSTLTPTDVGADAGAFTLSSDVFTPAVTFTPLGNATSLTTRVLTAFATVLDNVGSSASPSQPRIYYKRSVDADAFPGNTSADNGWKYAVATNTSSPYDFVIDYSIIFGGSAAVNDVIQYFVVAQDDGNNLASKAIGAMAAVNPPIQNISTAPALANLNSYTILNTFSGAFTVGGAGANYPTLTGAGGLFEAMNGGNIMVTGNITSTITGNTVEPGTNALNQWNDDPAGSNFTLTILPDAATVRLLSGTLNNGLFRFNGADNVIIDGRFSGSGNYLEFSNTNTVSPSATFHFINDASNNTIEYCTVKSVSLGTSTGAILFSTTTGTTGNDNNLIDHCNIRNGATLPVNLIVSIGTAAKTNSGNTISNCNIYNWFGSGANYGVWVSTNNDNWNITGNSFYQEAPRIPTGPTFPLYIQAGSGHSVIGNYIGGTAPLCGSGPMIINQAGNYGYNMFAAMYIKGGTPTPISIQGNTFQNIQINQTANSPAISYPQALIHLDAATVNMGNITPNLIGNQTVANSITLNKTANYAPQGYFYGLYLLGAGTNNITNNIFCGIGATCTQAITGTILAVIANTSANTVISGNTIGSTTLANAISQSGYSQLHGIYSSVGPVTITNNVISNLSHTNLESNAAIYNQLVGINVNQFHTGVYAITGNTIQNLTSSCPMTGSGISSALIGISFGATGAGQNISQNVIKGLTNTTVTSAVNITGIYYQGGTSGTNVLSKNFIHSFSLATSATTSSINGIFANAGTTSYSNNLIRLGIDAAGTEINTGYQINGINDNAGTNNFYFNSVFIGGTSVTGITSSTFAFNSSVVTNVWLFENNIFENVRSGGTTGKHYAIKVGGTAPNPAGLTSNYNVLYAPGITGGMLGLFNATDQTTLAGWQTTTGQDNNSLNTNPLFVNPTGAAALIDLHTSVPALNNRGLAIAGIVTDYANIVRTSPPDVGAYEFTLPITSINTFAATSIDKTTATLNGDINTTNEVVNLTFEYGLTNLYGSSALGVPATIQSLTPVPAIGPVTLLTPNTQYHYRIKGASATSSEIVYGSDMTFITLPDPVITGPSPICINSVGNVYSTETGNSNYVWNVSPGGAITAGGGLTDNSVTISWNASGPQWVSVNYNNSAGFPAPSPTVYAVTVDPLPDAAGLITGPPTFIPGTTGITYSVDPILNATGYLWAYSGTGATINGSGTSITIDFSPAATVGQLTVKGTNPCGDGLETSLSLTYTYRTLNVTLFFEGLYMGGGTMSQAWNSIGPQYGPGVADVVNVDLHDPVTFSTIHYTLNDVEVSTSGVATFLIPGIYSGTYYLSFHHRNSIETITAVTVSFGPSTLNYDFTASGSQAYGNNMKQMPDGKWAFYGGDANGDGTIDALDLIAEENDATLFSSGYILTDVNGDGVVDGLDLILVENNAFNFISVITP